MKKLLSLSFFIILLLLMLVIGSYNNTPVSVHFLVVQTQWPLAAVMSLMLFCGFIFGLITALIIASRKPKPATDKTAQQAAQQIEDSESSTNTELIAKGNS